MLEKNSVTQIKEQPLPVQHEEGDLLESTPHREIWKPNRDVKAGPGHHRSPAYAGKVPSTGEPFVA